MESGRDDELFRCEGPDIDAILQELNVPLGGSALLLDIAAAMDAQGWTGYQVNHAAGSVEVRVRGTLMVYHCIYLVHHDADLLRCYVRPCLFVPGSARDEVGEAVHRVNWDLPLRNLELDPSEEGELRYMTATDTSGGAPTPAALIGLAGTGIGTFDRYLPALVRVTHAGRAPEGAICEVEE